MSKLKVLGLVLAVGALLVGCQKSVDPEKVKMVFADAKYTAVSGEEDELVRAILDAVTVKGVEDLGDGSFSVTVVKPSITKMHAIAADDKEFQKSYTEAEDSREVLYAYYASLLQVGDVTEEATAEVVALDNETLVCNYFIDLRSMVAESISHEKFLFSEDEGGVGNDLDVNAITEIGVGSSFVVTQGSSKFLLTVDSVSKGIDAIEKLKELSPANEGIVTEEGATAVYVTCSVVTLNAKSKVLKNCFVVTSDRLRVKQQTGMALFGVPVEITVSGESSCFSDFLIVDSDDFILWYNSEETEVYRLVI